MLRQAGRLVEAVAVAARVEAEEAREHEADRGLVGDHDHLLVGWATTISRITGRARASTARPDSRALGGEREGVGLPGLVLARKALLDLLPREPLPAAVADLPQAVPVDGDEAVRPGEDVRGLHRAAERAAVDGADRVVGQALGQAADLGTALVGQVHAHRAREAVPRP